MMPQPTPQQIDAIIAILKEIAFQLSRQNDRLDEQWEWDQERDQQEQEKDADLDKRRVASEATLKMMSEAVTHTLLPPKPPGRPAMVVSMEPAVPATESTEANSFSQTKE